jgi:hypothetical protein
MKAGYMQIFYGFLGFLWIAAAIYIYLNDPSNNIILPVIYIIVGIAIGLLAYFYPKIFLGKYVKLTNKGIEGLLPSSEKIILIWDEIEAISIKDKTIDIKTKQSETINLKLSEMYDVEWKNLRKALNKIIHEKDLLKTDRD